MIQINPLKSYIDGGVRAALTTPPSASLVFDLPGKAIWVKGVKLKGTDHTYTFSHDNYITLTNTPDSNESEDIKIGVNTSALKSAIDTTYGVVSTTANGLAPKFTSGNKLAASTATTYYFLGWAGTTLKWYQAPFRNIRINSETTDRLGVNNTDPLIISSGNGISVTWDSTNKKIVITNTKPDVNHNTDRTGIKLATVSGTKKTDSTLILANSTSGLNIQGGTNKFLIGDGTNYIEVPVTPSFTVSNKDATIGTALTTIATIAGVDIKAKIALYSLYNHTHSVKINGSTKTITTPGAVDLGNYLPLSGGTMGGTAWIKWPDSGNISNNNEGVTFPVIRGGLEWRGQTDYIKLFSEETGRDNLNLVLQFGDDNSNGLSIRNASNVQTSYISAGGVITTKTFKGNLDWSYITNKPSSYTPSAHTHAWNSLTHSSTTENQAILTNGKANGWKLYTLNISGWNNAANNAHSHSNKSVLDGITSILVSNWNTAYNFVNTISGTDTDKVINKWDEIVNFLAGISEDNKLNTLLNSKLSVYELANNTNVGAIKNNGIYYSTSDASSGTLINSPFNTGFALINITSYDGGDDLRRSRLAFNAYGEIKISNDRGLANTAETWYNILTSKNTYVSENKGYINGTQITYVNNAGSATNATNAHKLVNWYSTRPTSLNTQFGDGSLRIFHATSSTTEGKSPDDAIILHLAWDNNGGWDTQLGINSPSGRVYSRAQNKGTWQSWKTLAFTTDIPTVTNYYWADLKISNNSNTATNPTVALLKATTGVQIGSTADYGWYLYNNRICAGINVARDINTGSLLVSSAWADSSKVPTNGIYSKGNILTAGGFIKSGSSNSYILLGGGGHKAVSDFAMASNYVKKTGDTMTGDLYINTNLYGPARGNNPRNIYGSEFYFYNCNSSTISTYNFGLYLWNNEFQFTYRTSANNSFKGNSFTIQGSDGQVIFTKTPKVGSTLVSLVGHTHSYLPLSGGTMTGNITYKGIGTSYIGNGENDAANGVGGALNNLVISSWHGISFTTSCSGLTYTNKNAVSINCRNGYVYANTFVGTFNGNASTATKLTSSAGNTALPIYFSDGKPVACVASSVFSNLSNNGNNLSITIAGQNRTLTVAYATTASMLKTSTWSGGYYATSDTHYMCLGYMDCTNYYDSLTLLITSAFWGNQHGSQDIITILQDTNTGSTKTIQTTVGRLRLGGSVERTFYYYKDNTNLRLYLYVYVTGGNSYGKWNISYLGGNATWVNVWQTNVTKDTSWSTIEYSAQVNYATLAGNASTATTASKLGTSTVGATNVPIYLNGGIPTVVNLNSTANNLINNLSVGDSVPADNDYYISQYVGGGTTTTSYHRRPHSALYAYIKGKAEGTWNISINGNAKGLSNNGDLNSQEKIDNFLTANRLEYATFKTTESNNIGLHGNDGMILSIPWSSANYGFQMAFDDTISGTVKVRGKNNSWGNWHTLLHSGNSNVSGGGNTWGSSITVNINGISKTLTIPGNPNTDYRVTQSETTTTNYRPLVIGYTNVSTAGSGMTGSVTNQVYLSNKFYVQPSTGNLYATNFVGALLGNASSATKLQTARTIWGQSFDGTGNIDGKLTLNYNNSNYPCGIEIFGTGEASVGMTINGVKGVIGRWGDTFNLWYNGNTRFAIKTNGNVGIGTTSPGYKLHVIGDIYATTGFKKNGSSDSYVLLGGGGHKLESNLNVAYSKYLTGITLTGGNGNNEGYRLIFERTMGAWSISYGVWAIAFRHSGRGILNIGFDTINSDGSTYTYNIRFLGSTASKESTPFRAFYNTTTKVFRIYWHYYDYTSGDIAVLRGNIEPYNGTWITSLPDDVGTELTITYNTADYATNADTVDGYHANSFALSGHTHNYLPLSGGTVTGPIEIKSSVNNNYNEGLRITRAANSWAGITFGSTGLSGAPTNGWFAATNPSDQFIISPDSSSNTAGLTLNRNGDALWKNNVIIHAGNYSSYCAPSNHTHNYAGSSSAGGAANSSNCLNYKGTGNNVLTAYQTSSSYMGSDASWASYIICNHGDGSSYYNLTIRMPFWGVPQYQRLVDGTYSGWKTFITSENISSLNVNYANSAGNADTVDGLHLYTRNLGINGSSWTFASTATANAAPHIYAATSTGTSGQILKSTGGTPTWMNQSDLIAGKITCTVGTSNVFRPIVLTNESNQLYYSTKIKGNYSTGKIQLSGIEIEDAAGNIPLIRFGSANKNSILWKVYSNGTTYANQGVYGFDMTYFGTGSGNTNRLVLHADNQNSATKVEAISITQDGVVTFSKTISGSINGNAATASKWAAARTLTLTGSVTGSVSFDGSGNVSLNTTTNHSHSWNSITNKPCTLISYSRNSENIDANNWKVKECSLIEIRNKELTYSNLAMSGYNSFFNFWTPDGIVCTQFQIGDGAFYYRSKQSGSLIITTSWHRVMDSNNCSVSKSGETLAVKINGTSQSLTNTWRGILDNLTSSTNTTQSLSAKLGYLLANGSARDNTKLPLSGGSLSGTLRIDCPTSQTNNYNEGIRCNLGGTNNWASVVLGGANGSTSGSGSGVYSLLVNSNLFRIRQNSTDVITINTNNNVGISTNSPSYKLHIVGDIYSSTYIRAASGFVKGGSSNSYVLLGGGGHKALSDFSMAHSHPYLSLSGGTMTGVIKSTYTSGSWIGGVTNAILKGEYTGYGAILSMPVKDGRVSLSSYPASNNFIYFGYATTAQINAGTNSFNKQMYWDAANNNLHADVFTGSLSGNASTATKWATARTLTIGNTGKSVNGSGNVSWSLAEIGAATSGHTHTLSLASDTGTSSITLVYGGKYKLTAGGNSVIFTLPTDNNTNPANYYWANIKVSASSSTSTTPQFGKVKINTTSSTYQLNVSGDSYVTGWSRAAKGFYCHDTGVHFTHNGTKGQIAITSNNEFCWGANNNTLYFNYAAPSLGTTVTNYIWNAGSSTSYASHTLGTLTSKSNIYAVHFYESSDIRQKTDFSSLNISTEELSTIPLFNFSWKNNLSSRNTGTSAQVVQSILPNIVTLSDNYLKLDYGVLGTIAGITACKELVTLKSELLQLKEKVKLLEDKLRKYENI